MKVSETALPGVLLIEPEVFEDSRGYFVTLWSQSSYARHELPNSYVQDNISKSLRGVIRGLHLQHPSGQGKLVSVGCGAVYDVAVDVRPDSPSFGQWVGEELSEGNHRQLYLPPGFAHGFCALSEMALVVYKCTAPYAPQHEIGIAYDDPDLGIEWPVDSPIVSQRDRANPRLAQLDRAMLPGV